MKHILTLCFILSVSATNAQQFFLTGGGQYATALTKAPTYNSVYGYTKNINDGFRWTVGAEFILKSKMGIEISNYNQTGNAEFFVDGFNPVYYTTKHNINWLMAKLNKYWDIKQDKISFLGGAGIGLASFKTSGVYNGANKSSLAWQAHSGLVFWPTRSLGLKASAEYQMSIQANPYAFSSKANSSFSQFAAGLSLMVNMNRLSEKN